MRTAFRWDADALLAPLGECRLRQGRLLERMRALGLALETEATADVLVEEALQTSAIEGERLDERAVRSSVARQNPAGGRSGRNVSYDIAWPEREETG